MNRLLQAADNLDERNRRWSEENLPQSAEAKTRRKRVKLVLGATVLTAATLGGLHLLGNEFVGALDNSAQQWEANNSSDLHPVLKETNPNSNPDLTTRVPTATSLENN